LAREAAGPVERWGGRILQFEQAPLSLVVRQLRERYGVEVELANEAIGRCALKATFEEEPVEQVLQVVAATFGLQVEPIAPGRYMLIGDGC
jgi:ferric-dicitrate binding protein FerR (iron transport regulator)